MIRRSLLTSLLIVVAVVAAGPAQAQARTYLPSCTFKDTYKPHAVNVFCADAGAYISRLHWSSWTSGSAHGTGRADVKTCNPNCATGGVERRRVRVALSRVRVCPSTGRRDFTRITVVYAGGEPRPLRQKVQCRPVSSGR